MSCTDGSAASSTGFAFSPRRRRARGHPWGHRSDDPGLSAPGAPCRPWPGTRSPTAACGASGAQSDDDLSTLQPRCKYCKERSDHMNPTALQLPRRERQAQVSRYHHDGRRRPADPVLPGRRGERGRVPRLREVRLGHGHRDQRTCAQDRRPERRRRRLLLRRHPLREVRAAGPLRRLPGPVPRLLAAATWRSPTAPSTSRNIEKAGYVRKLADDFQVVSEVGFKDSERSEHLAPDRWIECIHEDLDAGAFLVTLESRESGSSGICRPNGELRFGLIEEILASDVARRATCSSRRRRRSCSATSSSGSGPTSIWATSPPPRSSGSRRSGSASGPTRSSASRRPGVVRESRDVFHLAIPVDDLDEAEAFYVGRSAASWPGATPIASRSTSSATSWSAI